MLRAFTKTAKLSKKMQSFNLNCRKYILFIYWLISYFPKTSVDQISQRGIQGVCGALKKFPSLQNLNFSFEKWIIVWSFIEFFRFENITDNGLSQASKVLRRLPSSKKVGLSLIWYAIFGFFQYQQMKFLWNSAKSLFNNLKNYQFDRFAFLSMKNITLVKFQI